LALPFLFVCVPPLWDVPGHVAASALGTMVDRDPVLARFYGFSLAPVPNMASDVLALLLSRWVGAVGAYRLLAAAAPVSLGVGLLLVVRALGLRRPFALPWAFVFVWAFPLSYGFLNYLLGVALAFMAFAVLSLLDAQPVRREVAAWAAMPFLFACHAFAALVFALLVASREWASSRRWAELARSLRPLASLPILIVAWRLRAGSVHGATAWAAGPKANAMLMVLRDQDLVLDLGSLVAAAVAFAAAWRCGIRPHRALVAALVGLGLLFVVVPPQLAGSGFADARLLPLVPMLAFAGQDWSGAGDRAALAMLCSGIALLAVRLVVTTVGFVAYDASYADELGALRFVRPHSRIGILTGRDCDALRHWRTSRLGHLGDLAVPYRRSWVNSEWDVDGGHLLRIRYRPSPGFYDDPSQYVWPASCGGAAVGRPTVLHALGALPYGGLDYVWMIDAAPPSGWRDTRLVRRWRGRDSVLFEVGRTARGPRPGPSTGSGVRS
jgi:hypothetical protein